MTAETLEQLARRVAELVAEKARPAGLVDAETVAAYLGCERGWVYEHAAQLRARRLGEGPRARLRFLLDDVDEVLTCYPGRTSQGVASPAKPTVSSRRQVRPMGTNVALLPVKGSQPAP